MTTKPVRMAVVGTGGIGHLHVELAAANASVDLVAICGLDADAPALAERAGTTLVTDYKALADLDLEGVIVATPNHLHREVGEFFLDCGVAVVVEKPIADTVADGLRLCRAAERNGVALLVGQHRRFNALAAEAARIVGERLGTLVASNAMVTMKKPDSYYGVEWRQKASAGPLLVNLIHEVDLQRMICGEIEAVQAVSGRLVRSYEFEDTATILLHFASGAMGTMVIAESTPSPWSWEASMQDGMGHHFAGQDYARFLGTEGSLSFPSLTLWSYESASEAEPGWWAPLQARRFNTSAVNPYVAQIEHFARVIREAEEPVVSGEDGLRSLAVVQAVIEAAASGDIVGIDDVLARSDG